MGQCRSGSSPRLRGTPARKARMLALGRFIPAPAGNTRRGLSGCAGRSVHPRACGEHLRAGPIVRMRGGSSPRLRGTPLSPYPDINRRRFIPAPAGNTDARCPAAPAGSVHPRACGEHRKGWSGHRHDAGSSPRLRGTHLKPAKHDAPRRFIPAPAGNTLTPLLEYKPAAVHPRACGEHGSNPAAHAVGGGSSPRLRGTLHHDHARRSRLRFIPAPAGNTGRGTLTLTCPPVHPRACGEHRRAARTRLYGSGSSPRLRGTRLGASGAPAPERFIPAPAGNTHLIDLGHT